MGRIPCCEKDNVKRGQWTPEEDNKLSSYIAQHGTRNWRLIPKNAGSYTNLIPGVLIPQLYAVDYAPTKSFN